MENLAIDPGSSWSVGNSLGSDILPALSCGLLAIWIPAHVWEHEQHGEDPLPTPRATLLSSLREVPSLFNVPPRLS